MKKFFTENLWLKIISLILAITLELYFYSPDNSVTEEVEVRVDFRNIPRSKMIVSPSNPASINIKIKIKGPSSLVRDAKNRMSRLTVNLPSPLPSTFTFYPKDYIEPVSGVQIEEITPKQIPLVFEKIAKKEVLIILNQKGAPANGYEVEDISFRPESVIMRGPSSEVEKAVALETEVIDISGISENKNYDVRIVNNYQLSNLNVDFISVVVRVSEITEEKVIEGVPVRLLSPNGVATSFSPSKVDVKLGGSKLSLARLDKDKLFLIADARNLKEGEHKVTLNGEFPDGVKVISITPPLIDLKMYSKK